MPYSLISSSESLLSKMTGAIRRVFTRHSFFWRDRVLVQSTATALMMVSISLVVNYFAGVYSTEHASSPVTDIVLSNVRLRDVDGIFVYGTLFFWGIVFLLGILEPKRIPFIAKSVALFVFIRSIFISLTHIGPFPTQIAINSDVLSKFTFGGDLFFSGHVGLAFLMALIFWNQRWLRFFFIAFSLLFSVVVLLAHLHYTIDVASAFFITYTIYHLAGAAFPKDKKLFDLNIST